MFAIMSRPLGKTDWLVQPQTYAERTVAEEACAAMQGAPGVSYEFRVVSILTAEN